MTQNKVGLMSFNGSNNNYLYAIQKIIGILIKYFLKDKKWLKLLFCEF